MLRQTYGAHVELHRSVTKSKLCFQTTPQIVDTLYISPLKLFFQMTPRSYEISRDFDKENSVKTLRIHGPTSAGQLTLPISTGGTQHYMQQGASAAPSNMGTQLSTEVAIKKWPTHCSSH